MTKAMVFAVVTLAIASCSIFREGRYCYCKVEADECESIEVEMDQVENTDQREVENPGL